MDAYYGSYILPNGSMAQSTSIPYFPSYYGGIPIFYTRTLLPNGTTIISAQMNPQSSGAWSNDANIPVASLPTVPSPRQASFEEYWSQLSFEENSNAEHNRRHSLSTASAFSSDGSTSGTIMPNHSLALLPASSVATNSQTSPLATPVSHGATRYHSGATAPRLQLGTALDHGAPAFLPPPSMKVSPGANSANSTHSSEPSPVDARIMNNTTSGAQHTSGSTPLWHSVPRSAGPSGPPTSSIPRWNPSSSSWVPQASVASVPQPHVRAQAQAQMREFVDGLPTAFKAPLPISNDTMPQPVRRHTADAMPMPMPMSVPMPRMTTASSLVDRTTRPALSVRRRASTTSAVVNPSLVVKRKPLPKIYGCDGCGKKFDRPSTLKVHEAIHTGAKDHLCEYCIRAFTVQSNMKRHMRVCKHKPLSPPMSLCYILCTTPILPPHTSLLLPSSRAMNPVDRSNNLNLGASASAGTVIHPSLASGPNPMIRGASGEMSMIPFQYTYQLPDSELPIHPGPTPAPTVRGYRAPMIIAAMFSVQHKVPASLAKLTLVHLECDIPLPPVTPHPSQMSLYTGGDGLLTQPALVPPPLTFEPPYTRSSLASSSSDTVDSSITMANSVYTHPSLGSSSSLASSSSTCVGSTSHASMSDTMSMMSSTDVHIQVHAHIMRERDRRDVPADEDMKAQGLKKMPDINFEERNSYFPRSRYCYHPAEYDNIAVLPGPGTVALPSEDDENV